MRALSHDDGEPAPLTLTRDGSSSWLVSTPVTGQVIGTIAYVHNADGNHYHAWITGDGTRHSAGPAVPQLRLAVRAIAAAHHHREDPAPPSVG
jgi:hypothetical protein